MSYLQNFGEFMKTIVLAFSLFFTYSAFAMSDIDLSNKCSMRAIEKMQSDANLKHCELNRDSLEVYYIDNHFYNPTKYIGYNAGIKCIDGDASLFMLVQYDSISKECM